MRLGNLDVTNAYVGSNPVSKVMLGSSLVWELGGDEPEGGYQFVRVRFLGTGTQGLSEIEVLADDINVALERPVTVTPTDPMTPANTGVLVDGNTAVHHVISWWNSVVITIDLEQQFPLSIIRVLGRQGPNVAVDISEDGNTWIEIGSGAGTDFTI